MVNRKAGRVGNLERQMEEVNIRLKRLTEIEKKVERLDQGYSRILSDLKQVKKSLNPLGKSEKDSSDEVPQEITLQEDQHLEDLSVEEPAMGEGQNGKPETEEQFIPLLDLGVKGQRMKVKGRIQNKEVVVLVTIGTTHNFISFKLVKELHLPLMETGSYRVESTKDNRICKGVILEMPGVTIVEEFLPLQLLDNVDVILGSKWLTSLEKPEFYTEGGLFTIKIKKGEDEIVWRADPEL